MGGGHLRGGGVGGHGCSFPRPGRGGIGGGRTGQVPAQRDGEPGQGVDELGGRRPGQGP